jgi:hypothetical protein
LFRYVLAITRDARKGRRVDANQFEETLRRVPGIKVPEVVGPRVIVNYSGSAEELRRHLGYNANDVHIEGPVEHRLLM